MTPSSRISSNPAYQAIWESIVPELEETVTLLPVDRSALEQMVVNIALYHQALDELVAKGLTYTNAGLTKVNPAFASKQDLERVLHTAFHRFGMTPLDRKHIGVKPATDQGFAFDEPL